MDASGSLMVAKKAADGVAGLSALADPVVHTLAVQIHGGRRLRRVIGAHDFHEATVARAGLFGDHDAVERVLLLTNAGETNHQHCYILLKQNSNDQYSG